ncbi:MAG: hypothetical protein IJ184_06010 [Alphaproteobacteria bacterium]|nr:hypothetical protein [Alphaproteobacteria bacterium]
MKQVLNLREGIAIDENDILFVLAEDVDVFDLLICVAKHFKFESPLDVKQIKTVGDLISAICFYANPDDLPCAESDDKSE